MMPLGRLQESIHAGGAGLAPIREGIAAAKSQPQAILQHLKSMIPDKNAYQGEIG